MLRLIFQGSPIFAYLIPNPKLERDKQFYGLFEINDPRKTLILLFCLSKYCEIWIWRPHQKFDRIFEIS